MFSKSCEYGLRAIIYIAQQTNQNNKVSLMTISEEINSPQAFTAKILQQLTRNNIVKSIKLPRDWHFYAKKTTIQMLEQGYCFLIIGHKRLNSEKSKIATYRPTQSIKNPPQTTYLIAT